MSIWYFFVLVVSASAIKYNYTCTFNMPDKEVYDLSALARTRPPDYTYTDNEHLYVINFCGPAYKLCSGVEGSFASIWNATTKSCINTLGENNPVARYLDNRNKFKGIKIEYSHGRSVTRIEILCDQSYDTGVLMKANKLLGGAVFHFKSKLVCRNYAIHKNEGWSGTTILLILFIVGVVLYMCYNAYLNNKKGLYSSFGDAVPQKEFVMKAVLKGKELVNRVAESI